MTRKIPDFLKLHTVDDGSTDAASESANVANVATAAATLAPQIESNAVGQFCESFAQATGWRLNWRDAGGERRVPPGTLWSSPVTGLDGRPRARLSLEPSAGEDESTSDAEGNVPLSDAIALAKSFAAVLCELESTREGLWRREAELAAGVPIAARPEEETHLADRLEGVLRGGAEAIGCQAGAVYLLDEATTELKLRACWGLPKERLLAAPRPLKGAVADLEALVGHAVALEDTSLLPHWRCPEEFPAAVCVPVSSSTTVLGTMWLFCDIARDFTDEHTNLAEIVAGRLAADLEREMLLSQGARSQRMERGLSSAAHWQRQRMPSHPPLVDGWQFAGWTEQAHGVGGDFHDWNVLPDSRVALVVGDSHASMLEAGLSASVALASMRAHQIYGADPRKMTTALNESLWRDSTGDDYLSLFYGTLDPESGLLEFSLAGTVAAILVRDGKYERLTSEDAPLGARPDGRWRTCKRTMRKGDVLVAMTEGVREARDRGGLAIGDAAIASMVGRHPKSTAKALMEGLRKLLASPVDGRKSMDQSLLIVRRRP